MRGRNLRKDAEDLHLNGKDTPLHALESLMLAGYALDQVDRGLSRFGSISMDGPITGEGRPKLLAEIAGMIGELSSELTRVLDWGS